MEKVAGKDGVRVATLNLWARHGAWDERRSVLVDGFHELQPDVAAFQEAIKTDDYDQAGDLLGSRVHVVHQPGRSADGVGATIASRWLLVILVILAAPSRRATHWWLVARCRWSWADGSTTSWCAA
jgi:hypothetical protein